MAVCGIGAWASAIHAVERVLDSESPPTVVVPGCPPWLEAVLCDAGQQLLAGQRLSSAVYLDERLAAAGKQYLTSVL